MIAPGDEDDLLAAELAMGLLRGDESRDAGRRAASDPVFAAQVAAWEAMLAPLADLEPVAPPARVRNRLTAEIFPEPAEPAGAGFWKALAGLAAAAAVVLAVALSVVLRDPVTGPLYTAEIASAEGDFRVVAVVDKTRDEVVLTRTEGAAPPGRILQVWAHGPDEPAQSVGLWPEGESVRLPLPPEIAAVEGVLTLGVSEEPPGGSPTGSPTGRVFGTVDIPDVTGS
jgi:anti-sigma-K factor RskA